MAEMDFPSSPTVGDRYTNSIGVVYEWNGASWVVGFFDPIIGDFTLLGDILAQVRIVLQDTDETGGQFRYSTNSIVMAINQGMLEMYRVRPDIFLELGFKVPQFNAGQPDASWPLEQQWVPPIVYYAVGFTQVRDDEGTQDTRAGAFLARFNAMLVPPP